MTSKLWVSTSFFVPICIRKTKTSCRPIALLVSVARRRSGMGRRMADGVVLERRHRRTLTPSKWRITQSRAVLGRRRRRRPSRHFLTTMIGRYLPSAANHLLSQCVMKKTKHQILVWSGRVLLWECMWCFAGCLRAPGFKRWVRHHRRLCVGIVGNWCRRCRRRYPSLLQVNDSTFSER